VIERGPMPNEQALEYLNSIPRADQPFWILPAEEARKDFRNECFVYAGHGELVETVRDELIAGVKCREYLPGENISEVFVWFHGGGWTIGDPGCYDAAMRAIANMANCAIISVDYRLAPESIYPAAIEDAWAVTVWASTHFKKVAVGGDSSGGNLAAAVALRARDAGIELSLQILVYPVLDYRVDSPEYEDFAHEYREFGGRTGYGAESRDTIRAIWNRYIPSPELRREPDASPFRSNSFGAIAPLLMLLAEHDILRREGEEYARLLEGEAGDVEVVIYEGQIHGFYHLLKQFDDARDAVSRTAAALRGAFCC
jgi:acetyl esterase